MCILIYKPKNVSLQSFTKKMHDNCWENNPDGGGFAIWNNKKETWEVHKGFLKSKKFWKFIEKHRYIKDRPIIIHYRYGSSCSLNKAGGTHPFPVSNSLDEMKKIVFFSDKIVFHNGTVQRGCESYSDTMIWTRDLIRPLIKYINDKEIYKLVLPHILKTDNNKWIITDKEKCFMFGKDWVKKEGIYYSNDSYKEKVRYFVGFNFNGWKNQQYWRQWNQKYDYKQNKKERFAFCPYCVSNTLVEKTHKTIYVTQNNKEYQHWLCKKCGTRFKTKPNEYYPGLDAIIDVEPKIRQQYAKAQAKAINNAIICGECKTNAYITILRKAKTETRYLCQKCGKIIQSNHKGMVKLIGWDLQIKNKHEKEKNNAKTI